MAGGRIWTVEEYEFLKANYGSMAIEEIAERFGRTKKAVEKKCCDLGLTKRDDKWTEYELAIIQEEYVTANLDELAEKLGRTRTAIKHRATMLGVKRRVFWSDEELEYLHQWWGIKKPKVIAEMINRSEEAVLKKASEEGLGTRVGDGYTATELAHLLGVSKHRVCVFINKYGLVAKKNRSLKRKTYCIKEKEIIKFLRDNQELWDSRKLTVNIFLQKNKKNPEWFEEKLKKDRQGESYKEINYWSPREDKVLLDLFFKGYTQKEIAEELGRSWGAVNHRIKRLNWGRKGA
ncbi:MAG: winged helix-turn-helix transcriptional regulator [Turicibacter sp.]|nr:winged helix-turn-helix transcriptional regulator [Turicibacter sp.]